MTLVWLQSGELVEPAWDASAQELLPSLSRGHPDEFAAAMGVIRPGLFQGPATPSNRGSA
jgi:hypothetical protein